MRSVVLEFSYEEWPTFFVRGFIFNSQNLCFPQYVSLPYSHILQAIWYAFRMITISFIFTLSESAEVLEDGSFVQMLFLRVVICDNSTRTLTRKIYILQKIRIVVLLMKFKNHSVQLIWKNERTHSFFGVRMSSYLMGKYNIFLLGKLWGGKNGQAET